MGTMTCTRAWLGGLALLTACQAVAIDNETALDAEKLEILVDARGVPVEIEYHVTPDAVPQDVRDAMELLYPGGEDVGAEIEWHDGVLYYELTRVRDGFAAESMFTAKGGLHSEEVEVAPGSVPQAVKDAIAARWPQGRVKAWEEIRDGARELVEYHVKLGEGGRNIKAAVTVDGAITGAWRETEAEIEVPLD